MQINEVTFPVEFDWEGELVLPTSVFSSESRELPSVSLGQPTWWSDHQVFGDSWTKPAGDKRYGLARFAFSLRPKNNQKIRKVELTIYLQAQDGGKNPIIFDLFPKNLTEEQQGEIKAGINPKLKFTQVAEASIGSIEVTTSRRKAQAVITADGIGENTARWTFQAHPTTPLIGSQIVYATVELPRSTTTTCVTVQISAEVTTKFGLVRGLLPKTDRDRHRWTLNTYQ
jgi:hypothetical protein